MSRGYRIGLASLALAIACGASQSNARPVIAGYERFHAERASVEGGRLLFNELGCVNCHRVKTDLPDRKGPRLDGIAQRVRGDWLQAYLQDPQSMKPGTTMPDMGLSPAEAEAVARYLTSIPSKGKRPKAFKFVNRERGEILYRSIGCVACHGPDPLARSSNDPRYVALPDLKAKSDIHALSAYLQNPHTIHPEGRMPRFPFEREDIGDIAAYLLDYANGDATDYPSIANPSSDSALATLGEAIFESKSCISCHDTNQSSDSIHPELRPIRQLEIPSTNHPTYALSPSQAQSIHAFLRAVSEKDIDRAPAKTALQALNCLACHERDGSGGPPPELNAFFEGDPDLGDTGRLPPPLTDIGRKLQPNWLEEAIAGHPTVRPYLKTRMPDFGKSVYSIASKLVEDDRQSSQLEIDPQLVEAGRHLLGTEGGLNCITCHGYKDRPSLGINSLNLETLSERLQPDWLREFLIDPASHRPNTLMPSFWPMGIASNRTILNGDTDSQIAAILAYSKYGDGYPTGMPEKGAAGYELVPTDRPIVQRAFFGEVGTHAILVGFPEGIHVAIDGQTGRPAMLWKERFFDAYNTWFSRFPPFEAPLGEAVVRWDRDPTTTAMQRFRGYRLDEKGIPEFLSEFAGAPCYESLVPVLDQDGVLFFQRTITFTREGQRNGYPIDHPRGVDTRELPSTQPLVQRFQYRW